MRTYTILFALVFLGSCPPSGPPHPTHPTKVECSIQVETRYQATIGTIIEHPGDPTQYRPPEDSCYSASHFNRIEVWTQQAEMRVPICVPAGTTPERAATACFRHLESTGRGVGANALPLLPAIAPVPGHICPGTESPLWSRVVSIGGTPSLHPDGCREGTGWTLIDP